MPTAADASKPTACIQLAVAVRTLGRLGDDDRLARRDVGAAGALIGDEDLQPVARGGGDADVGAAIAAD